MQERIIRLLEMEKLTPSKFADIIGVQRSSVSHVLSGRNKPSFDFLEKTLIAFPGLKADWLMLGKGTMYEQMGRSDDLFGQELDSVEDNHFSENGTDSSTSKESVAENLSSSDITQMPVNEEDASEVRPDGPKKVIQVMVFYSDNTFNTYRPSE